MGKTRCCALAAQIRCQLSLALIVVGVLVYLNKKHSMMMYMDHSDHAGHEMEAKI